MEEASWHAREDEAEMRQLQRPNVLLLELCHDTFDALIIICCWSNLFPLNIKPNGSRCLRYVLHPGVKDVFYALRGRNSSRIQYFGSQKSLLRQ